MSYESRATVLEKKANKSRLSGEKIKLSDIRMNGMRLSHKCLATVVQVRMKLSYPRETPECPVTVARVSRVVRYFCKIRPKFATLSHVCPFNETAT